jgi:hypothetical protein
MKACREAAEARIETGQEQIDAKIKTGLEKVKAMGLEANPGEIEAAVEAIGALEGQSGGQ